MKTKTKTNKVWRVGIDVSRRSLEVAAARLGEKQQRKLDNSPSGFQQLIRWLTQGRHQAQVCLESTGVYGLDLAVALHRAPGIEVMVLNPRAARRFAEALLRRSKTDRVDADVLLEYVERMPFAPWQPPAPLRLQLRALSRRIQALTDMCTAEKNRLHAAECTEQLEILRADLRESIAQLEARILRLEEQARELAQQDAHLVNCLQHLCSIRGVAELSGLRILAEVCVLPEDLSARQWVAHAGLDPRHVESGTSVNKPARISKAGNRYFRASTYMPAHNAILWEPQVKAFYDHLVAKGKHKMQAKTAVMRKLLHSIHAMLRLDVDFDGQKFFAQGA